MAENAEIAGLIESIDWSSPDTVQEDGKKLFSVRCRFPFTTPTPDAPQIKRDAVPAERVIIDDGDGVKLPDDATGDPGTDDEVELSDPFLVSGIASSTSVDHYGTEMSLDALQNMAKQMAGKGVPYLPRHNKGSSGAIEWDEIIGRTVFAEVVPTDGVAKAFSKDEKQYKLRVTIKLYEDEPLAQALVRRVNRGETIGQSIGGWFTELQVVQNDDGEVERVIVQGVELDHLAVTRAPANPDSVGIASLRDALQDSACSHQASSLVERLLGGEAVRTTPEIACMIPIQERHIVKAMDNGDGTVTVVFALMEKEEDEDRGSGYKKKKEEKSVTSFADLPMAPVDEAWSWDTDASNAVLGDPPNWERYARAHIWADEDSDETKSGYKLPVARMFGDTLRVVFRGVAAAMAAVNGARGGVDLPDTERKKAYDHLVRYYAKFDREPPAFQASAIEHSLDTESTTAHDANSDARRSALADSSSPNPADAGAMSEEHNMTEQDLLDMQNALRTAVSEATAPLVERVAALETAAAQRTVVTEPEIEAEPTIDERVAAAERAVADALSRAEAAEKALAAANRRPMRVGRSVVPNIPAGPAGSVTANSLVERSRQGAPTIATVADRSVDIVTDASEPGTKVSRGQLEQTLRSLLKAAEADGVITDPNHRAYWQ